MVRLSPRLLIALRALSLMVFCTLLSPLLANNLDLQPPSSCVFSGSFNQSKSLIGLQSPLQSNGVFFYHCDLGVVWKTVAPVQETLVLNRGGRSYKVEDGQKIILTSRQSKLLGELINGLIGGNQRYLREHFEVSGNASEAITSGTQIHLLLIPKNPRMKRALQRIELILPSPEQPVLVEEVSFSMLDRNQQWTHIISTKQAEYSDDTNALAHCHDLDSITARECALLQAVPAP